MSQNNDVASLLSSLDNFNSQNVKNIFIPSVNREVPFKMLTAAQHKNIITTIMDQNNAGITFSLLMNQIILENSVEKINFNLADKAYILICLRALSLSSIFNNKEQTIDLQPLINNKIPLNLTPITIEESDYKITIFPPSLAKDSVVNKITKQKIDDNIDDKNVNKIALDEIYTNEFAKYINSIEFVINNVSIAVNFDTLKHDTKQQVISKIPASTISKILIEINNLKKISEQFLIIDDKKVDINIDQAFFTV